MKLFKIAHAFGLYKIKNNRRRLLSVKFDYIELNKYGVEVKEDENGGEI